MAEKGMTVTVEMADPIGLKFAAVASVEEALFPSSHAFIDREMKGADGHHKTLRALLAGRGAAQGTEDELTFLGLVRDEAIRAAVGCYRVARSVEQCISLGGEPKEGDASGEDPRQTTIFEGLETEAAEKVENPPADDEPAQEEAVDAMDADPWVIRLRKAETQDAFDEAWDDYEAAVAAALKAAHVQRRNLPERLSDVEFYDDTDREPLDDVIRRARGKKTDEAHRLIELLEPLEVMVKIDSPEADPSSE